MRWLLEAHGENILDACGFFNFCSKSGAQMVSVGCGTTFEKVDVVFTTLECGPGGSIDMQEVRRRKANAWQRSVPSPK